MMDGDKMYPEGFHPVRVNYTPDRSDFAEHTSRSAVGVKYYFVDFGISVHIPEGLRPGLVQGLLGRDQEPPELSARVPGNPLEQVPYDPFKLDVFMIGNMLKREFYKVRVCLMQISASSDDNQVFLQPQNFQASDSEDDSSNAL